MEREEWLKKVRAQVEAIYDHLAPLYWEKFGFYDNETHRQFVEKLLGRLKPHSSVLDAACGAGRYDGQLIEAGHTVLGIDQSGYMLAKAREHFPANEYPQLSYEKLGLQEMDFKEQFDGAICMDAMENVFPEDWPGVMMRFQRALKPGGVLYFTMELAEQEEVREAYELARGQGLPVVMGEMADKIEASFEQVMALDWQSITGEIAGRAVYHYYPEVEQVRAWVEQAGVKIVEEGCGNGYAHFLVRKENEG